MLKYFFWRCVIVSLISAFMVLSVVFLMDRTSSCYHAVTYNTLDTYFNGQNLSLVAHGSLVHPLFSCSVVERRLKGLGSFFCESIERRAFLVWEGYWVILFTKQTWNPLTTVAFAKIQPMMDWWRIILFQTLLLLCGNNRVTKGEFES